MLKTLAAGIFAASSALADGAAAPATVGTYNGYEIPVYTVTRRDGPFELRAYDPYLAAEVTVRGGRDQAVRQGFRALAGFIFGGNTPAEKIAMTAPVTQEAQSAKIAMTAPVTQEAAAGGGGAQSGDAWVIRFMMPRAYSAETLPRPTNGAVRIVTVTPGDRLTLVFSGMTGTRAVLQREAQLRAYAEAQGMRLDGPIELARYNDPFTAPWKRRNEVSAAIAR